jgi:hypothetical protein
MLRTSEPERHWQGSLAPEAIGQSPSLTTAGGPIERNWPGRPTSRSSRRGPVRWHVRADLHGRHASRSSLRPRLRLSRRLARRREVGIERAAQLSVIVLDRRKIPQHLRDHQSHRQSDFGGGVFCAFRVSAII